MNVQDLINALLEVVHTNGRDVEIRIGHEVEGPTLHQKVGGVWTIPDNEGGVSGVVLCADDDDLWKDETDNPRLMKEVWTPPSP